MIKILLFLLLLHTLAGPSFAEHEVYYRYTVLGYLKDARGTPLSGVTVSLTREKTGFRIYVVGSRGSGGRSRAHPRIMEDFL